MSERYIPREGPKLRMDEIKPATTRGKHIVEKIKVYLIELWLEFESMGPEQQALEVWRLYRRHALCDMRD